MLKTIIFAAFLGESLGLSSSKVQAAASWGPETGFTGFPSGVAEAMNNIRYVAQVTKRVNQAAAPQVDQNRWNMDTNAAGINAMLGENSQKAAYWNKQMNTDNRAKGWANAYQSMEAGKRGKTLNDGFMHQANEGNSWSEAAQRYAEAAWTNSRQAVDGYEAIRSSVEEKVQVDPVINSMGPRNPGYRGIWPAKPTDPPDTSSVFSPSLQKEWGKNGRNYDENGPINDANTPRRR